VTYFEIAIVITGLLGVVALFRISGAIRDVSQDLEAVARALKFPPERIPPDHYVPPLRVRVKADDLHAAVAGGIVDGMKRYRAWQHAMRMSRRLQP
jgi:hypothetical protein